MTLALGVLAIVGWVLYLYAREDAAQWRILATMRRDECGAELVSR